jgi:hypothetical protein
MFDEKDLQKIDQVFEKKMRVLLVEKNEILKWKYGFSMVLAISSVGQSSHRLTGTSGGLLNSNKE